MGGISPGSLMLMNGWLRAAAPFERVSRLVSWEEASGVKANVGQQVVQTPAAIERVLTRLSIRSSLRPSINLVVKEADEASAFLVRLHHLGMREQRECGRGLCSRSASCGCREGRGD